MSKYTISILEFVASQPAHRLPVVFTKENSPLPDCEETPEEILKEVLSLEKQGWIEAHVIRDVVGKPARVDIRYVTLEGRVFLDSRNIKNPEELPLKKILLWVGGGILILIAALLGSHLLSLRSAKGTLKMEAPVGVPTPSPTATPLATALDTPSATQVAIPLASPLASPVAISGATPEASPLASPSPLSTPTPSPTVAATPQAQSTPSPKSGEAKSKQHSFKKEW